MTKYIGSKYYKTVNSLKYKFLMFKIINYQVHFKKSIIF